MIHGDDDGDGGGGGCGGGGDDDDDDDDDDDGVMKEMKYAYNYCAFAPQLSMVLFTLACGPVYFCV